MLKKNFNKFLSQYSRQSQKKRLALGHNKKNHHFKTAIS